MVKVVENKEGKELKCGSEKESEEETNLDLSLQELLLVGEWPV